MSDFFDDPNVGAAKRYILSPRRAKVRDLVCDAVLKVRLSLHKAFSRQVRAKEIRRVLIVGVSVPSRTQDMDDVVSKLVESRHEVSTSIVPMVKGLGKFTNVETAISSAPESLDSYDWLVITDDDIEFKPGFLDAMIDYAETFDLTFVQPAHKFHSHTSFEITQRHWWSLVRETQFVEIGPITLLHKRALSTLVPFPESRWCWGIDVYWSKLARDNGWKMGIIDAEPVGHMRPIAATYDFNAAIEEARRLLARFGVSDKREKIFALNKRLA